MPEIPEHCEFDVPIDGLSFSTMTNGDVIRIRNINLGKEQAATLAWLVNEHAVLKIEIKLKE